MMTTLTHVLSHENSIGFSKGGACAHLDHYLKSTSLMLQRDITILVCHVLNKIENKKKVEMYFLINVCYCHTAKNLK